MRYIPIVILILLFISCSGDSGIELVQGGNRGNNRDRNKDSEVEKEMIEGVSSERLSTLFFAEAYIFRPKKPTTTQKTTTVKRTLPTVNAWDYKVIADWMVSNRRHIKVKNLKTNVEIIVKEGQKTGEIVLIERTFFNYKLKIKGQIIEVAR